MAKEIPVIAAGVEVSVDMVDCDIEDYVWPQSGQRQEAAGKLRAFLDSDGNLVAYQRIEVPAHTRLLQYVPTPRYSGEGVVPLMTRSSASITPKEVMRYAGRHFKGGRSRTLGRSELRRKKQECRPLTMKQIEQGRRIPTGKPPLEDAVERVVAKVKMFRENRHAA